STDRTMGGPTTQMWIDPWLNALRSLGVTLHTERTCVALEAENGRVARVRFASGATVGDPGDQFVLAVPIDAAQRLMSDELAALDPQCAQLRTANIGAMVSWMVGMQFFLY